MNTLYYGDNLDSLRRLRDETVDLCYIDPPFNSKRNYNQIYNNVGKEDRAQAQAFTDTWTWDEQASSGLLEITTNQSGHFQRQTIELIKGLRNVLKEGSLLAYLVSMTRRIVEIQRILKPTGSFYLHCDPNASHYLKLVLDGVFCSQGGDFLNEIIWYYKTGGMSKRWFGRKHDILFFYVKSKDYYFNPLKEKSYLAHKYGFKNIEIKEDEGGLYTEVGMRDVWDIPALRGNQPETLGYPTQKPEALLERVLQASTKEGDLVLDAYCGCGTSVAVAQRLNRRWIGMDITFQSISLVLKRLEDSFGADVVANTVLDGVPKDMASAIALAHKKDDRLRKEFEKWAVLTYTMNRAAINEKKGADAGVDGIAYFLTGPTETGKMVFQVKSGRVGRGDIAKLNSDRQREGAELATLITLEEPTSPMKSEARSAGVYVHSFTGRTQPRIQIVTVREIVENRKTLDLPLSVEALKVAPKIAAKADQRDLGFEKRA